MIQKIVKIKKEKVTTIETTYSLFGLVKVQQEQVTALICVLSLIAVYFEHGIALLLIPICGLLLVLLVLSYTDVKVEKLDEMV